MNRQLLEQPFPAEQIKQRAGSFGKSLSYVESHAIIQRLNDAFDGQWSFVIMSHEILDNEVIVQGKLTAEGICKVQFGSSQVTRNKDTREVISLADDLKAAATDALKKAATLFGVGLHLYAGKPDVSTPRPEVKLVGGNNSSGGNTGNGNNGRLSQKQHSFLLNLGDERGLPRRELNQMSLERFGVGLDFLSRNDASSFIGELMSLAA